jgi:hypothetical protein
MKKILSIAIVCGYMGANDMLEYKCISCHKAQQVPSEMIYKKYLMQYSTKDDIAKAMFIYLKSPQISTSIMPKPFFAKFPTKKPSTLTDEELKKLIRLYIDKYDIVKKLRLKE